MSAPTLGRMANELTLSLALAPVGPLLIKAPDSGADPTRPDMEFVRTWRAGAQQVYLPGSSLKGALRVQCERLVRSVGGDSRRDGVWACDPLYIERRCANGERGAAAYRGACTVCRLFGNTDLRGRLAIDDAYPAPGTDLRLEERVNVAIDRVMGSVFQGPFRYEVVTGGSFATTLRLRNVAVAQVGLLGLALRDVRDGRVAFGFGKSRGMGRVSLSVDALRISYPAGAAPEAGRFRGALHRGEGEQADEVEVPGLDYEDDDLAFERRATLAGDQAVLGFWRACAAVWRREANG